MSNKQLPIFYNDRAKLELSSWQKEMTKNPSIVNRYTKKLQDKINSYIPEKAHNAITNVVKQMFRTVLFGSELTAIAPRAEGSLELRESIINEKIEFYKKTGAVEGGITGAGGILLGLADFPLFMGIKIKMLFDIAAVYGVDVKDYKERLYILYIFQLAFSSRQRRKDIYNIIVDWTNYSATLPQDINQFDWRTFQQEYRDYLDISKMLQLVPIIGAPVGAYVNYQMIDKLGKTAMNAYRLRLGDKLL